MRQEWIALGSASLALWIACGVQAARGRPVIPARQAEPAGWPPWTAASVLFLGALVVPWLQTVPHVAVHGLQLYSAAALTLVVLAPLLMSRTYAVRWSDFGLWRSRWGIDVLLGAGGFVASVLPVYALTLPLNQLRQQHPHKMLKILEGTGWQGLFWIVVAAVIAAPLVEELAYRVILQGSLETSMPKRHTVVISSLVFALVHQWTDWIPLFALALILGTIYTRRRSYVAVVVLHSLFNAFGLILTFVERQ